MLRLLPACHRDILVEHAILVRARIDRGEAGELAERSTIARTRLSRLRPIAALRKLLSLESF